MATDAFVAVDTSRKAGFWIRVGAYLIDGILLGIIGVILRQIFGTSAGGGLGTLLSIVYFVYCWSSLTQTIGMKALNLRVVKTDGTKLTIADAIIRYIGIVISTIVIFLGLMWVGWDPNKQGWHDKMAKTYVVKA